jgi:hypothetical protein
LGTSSPSARPSASFAPAASFSAPNNYPPASWQPFAGNSVWNTPIGANVKPDPNSAEYQNFYAKYYPISGAFGLSNESQQYEHPLYYGRATDPVYNVVCQASWATCVGAQTVHVPTYAIPAEGGDHHLSVLDQTTGTEFDFWETNQLSGDGGTITAQSAGSGPLTGPGLNWGTTGAGFPLSAGVIRAQELIAGVIPHALFLVAPCSSDLSVYPSVSRTSDTACPNGQGAPYGGWIRLNMSPGQVVALGAPAYKVPIYLALAAYGAFIGDTNNFSGFGIQFEADEMYTAPGYQSPGCPTNGAPCTPLTAYFHSIGDPEWNGSRYAVILSEVPSSQYQWVLPPSH